MKPVSFAPAAIAQPTPSEFELSGYWTALGIGAIDRHLETLTAPEKTEVVVDGTGVGGLDTVGVWIVQKLLQRLRGEGHTVQLRGWSPQHAKLLDMVAQHPDTRPPSPPHPSPLERIGRTAGAAGGQTIALLSFIGESAVALAGSIVHPARLRWRPVLYNIRSAGFDALPIVGMLSFLMGIVVAYQAADQLRRYGANIFVADLVGLSMLREFAPLMTAIIVAGRSGSAYAAQIGTMSVTEEIDAMRTIGIPPVGLLVLPKFLALVLVLPLLTFFADVLGVYGGMIMARSQLGVGFEDFLGRFTKAVTPMAYLIGIGKAPVFAAIIVMIGCFQGFRTRGGADSVGRQTTRSVVQSIFLVIVADALFSILFSFLGI
jgi:phospholipid/cholesterol/gamma-HCH transport system permease protein